MAAIIRRTWTRKDLDERGRERRTKLVAYGYDLRVNGRRERRWSADWLTEARARAVLAEREAAIAAGRVAPASRTLGQVVEEP